MCRTINLKEHDSVSGEFSQKEALSAKQTSSKLLLDIYLTAHISGAVYGSQETRFNLSNT